MTYHRIRCCIIIAALYAALFAEPAVSSCASGSTFCSVGHSKRWVGDIRQSSKLREMLEAVTFKKELIISIYSHMPDGGYTHVWEDQLYQLHHELLDVGFAHHVFITMSEGACKQIARPSLSCVWDSSDLPAWILADEPALWHQRWKLMARAVRLGFNVMSVDLDSIFFRDPYVHLKRPPLNQVQMLCNPEGGSSFNCNGGFVYVQNARPDGPVSWLWMQVIRDTLWRADDGYQFLSRWWRDSGPVRNCVPFDQALIMQAVETAAVGRPVMRIAAAQCKRGSKFQTPGGKTLTTDQVVRNIEGLVLSHARTSVVQVKPDPEWLHGIGFNSVPLPDTWAVVGNLTVPNLNWGYPEELGGRFYPPGTPSGNFTGPWMRMLKEDCPSCPWWPEEQPLPASEDPVSYLCGSQLEQRLREHPEDLHAFIDPAIPKEVFGHMPGWLTTSLTRGRRGTTLGPKASMRQGPLSVGHVHSWPLQMSRAAHKMMVRKVMARYNWTLGTEIANAHRRPLPYMHGRVNHVLALSPDIDLARTRSWHELASIIAGLVQVARLSRRVLLMPNLPCQTSWIHGQADVLDEELNQTLCVAPTFWRHADSWPLPVVVPVDEQGEVVGGWARRLLAAAAWQPSGPASVMPPQQVSPLVLRPGWPMRGSMHQRHLTTDTTFLSDPWWEQQRYVAVMPQLWDQPCTQGLQAIIAPEFHHWVKHTKAGRKAQLRPSAANTVLLPGPSQPGLSLQPPQDAGPGTSSKQVPVGHVLQPREDEGWSWRDVQVAVPSAQVARELMRVADQPLVYVGHPTMVVPSPPEQDDALAGYLDSTRQQHHTVQADAATAAASNTPNSVLQQLNEHLAATSCKGVWEEPATQRGKVVDLAAGLPADVVNGRLQLRPQAP